MQKKIFGSLFQCSSKMEEMAVILPSKQVGIWTFVSWEGKPVGKEKNTILFRIHTSFVGELYCCISPCTYSFEFPNWLMSSLIYKINIITIHCQKMLAAVSAVVVATEQEGENSREGTGKKIVISYVLLQATATQMSCSSPAYLSVICWHWQIVSGLSSRWWSDNDRQSTGRSIMVLLYILTPTPTPTPWLIPVCRFTYRKKSG